LANSGRWLHFLLAFFCCNLAAFVPLLRDFTSWTAHLYTYHRAGRPSQAAAAPPDPPLPPHVLAFPAPPAMFEQAFRNIDDILRKEAGCTTELDYTEQTSWLLFLKYLDGLEQDPADEAV
jgi:hypothetical protein